MRVQTSKHAIILHNHKGVFLFKVLIVSWMVVLYVSIRSDNVFLRRANDSYNLDIICESYKSQNYTIILPIGIPYRTAILAKIEAQYSIFVYGKLFILQQNGHFDAFSLIDVIKCTKEKYKH